MLVAHATEVELEAAIDEILQSPKDAGEVKLIVRRPRVNEREVLEEAQFSVEEGLTGDTWRFRASSKMPDRKSPHPERQITIMNARVAAFVARHPDRWALAGDQLFIDLDLTEANLPPGTRLALGSVVLALTPQAHTGCGKFVERFGLDAMKFVNSPAGRELRLRGIYARVEQSGIVRRGDIARKI